jgi:hypothetical protein
MALIYGSKDSQAPAGLPKAHRSIASHVDSTDDQIVSDKDKNAAASLDKNWVPPEERQARAARDRDAAASLDKSRVPSTDRRARLPGRRDDNKG